MGSQNSGYATNQYMQPQAPTYSSGAAQYQYSNSAVGGGEYGSFDEDAPLLEELGIDVPAIVHRIKAIMTFRFAASDADSLDLGGPIIFMSIFAMAHLLVGKLHFGYILGWMVVGSTLLWFILSSISAGTSDGDAGEGNQLDLYSCCSIVGYSLLPLVIHALLSLLFPRRSMLTFSIAILAVLWATGTASKLFVLRSRPLRGKNVVVAYPCMLMYTAFALLTLY
jgi:protein YIPF5/7